MKKSLDEIALEFEDYKSFCKEKGLKPSHPESLDKFKKSNKGGK